VTPKKNYSRYFIILQEDEKGYSLDSGKIPSGYAKLEMKNSKCKISYYVQNLRKEKQPYYMVLICGKKEVNKIIKVGKVNIDDHGRLDISHEFDMDNIADTGISSEKIIGAAIVKFLDTNVISIMSGFSTTDKPIEWKGYKIADSSNEKKEARAEVVVNEFDEYEQGIELIKVSKQEKVTSQDAKQLEKQTNVDEQKCKDEVKVDQRSVIERDEPLELPKNIKEEIIDVKEDNGQRVTAKKIDLLEDQKNVVEEKFEEKEEVEEEVEVEVEKEMEQRGTAQKTEPLEIQKDIDEVEIDLCEDDGQRVTDKNIETSNVKHEEIEVNKLEDVCDESRHKEHHKDDKKHDECGCKDNNPCNDGYPKGVMGDYFKAVAQDFDVVHDFTKEIKWCTWYKVPVHNLENMYDLSDYNKYTIAYYPMICYYPYIRNYKSFMLGYKCDSEGEMKYIIYGIPGSRAKAHQPYGGKTGFVTWIANKDNDEMGHWLMFYDFRNSTIVVPIKK